MAVQAVTGAEALQPTSDKKGRAVHTFEVNSALSSSIKTMGLVELTSDEELLATKRAHGDPVRLALELAKTCLYEVNGQRVKLMDGTTDRYWDEMSAPLRNLVLGAFNELHNPTEEQTKDFLKSRKVTVR